MLKRIELHDGCSVIFEGAKTAHGDDTLFVKRNAMPRNAATREQADITAALIGCAIPSNFTEKKTNENSDQISPCAGAD